MFLIIFLFSSLYLNLCLDSQNKENFTIYLASDSTVRIYDDNLYIAGWGKYLSLFLDENVKVINAAQGGRSSRSFINEGRLYDIEGCKVKFEQNNGKSIGSVIKPGDYLFIQFAHNDDETPMPELYIKIYDRTVQLGKPQNGIYPTIEGTRIKTTILPSAFTDLATESEIKNALATIKLYGETYYGYDFGTYKWYLKQYIDLARSKGAIPVLITPVSRVNFKDGKIVAGKGNFGENFGYVQAVRQLAEEEDCLLIDLHAKTLQMFELATEEYASYFMALKPNELEGKWPNGYDSTYGDESKGCTGLDGTHYNKYGAFLVAGIVADSIIQGKESVHNNNKESFLFTDYIKTKPKDYIQHSSKITKEIIEKISKVFSYVNPTD